MTDPAHLERRAGFLELRAAGRRLEGHAALFNVEAQIADFSEVVAPGAFAESLRSGRDILALVDHDPGRLLARTRSGTLRLAEDARGLAFDLEVPDTATGRDLLALAERRDLGGMSFGFTVTRGGDTWSGRRRELRAVTLHEISVVQAWPAYVGTDVNARSLGAADRRLPLVVARRYLELTR